jgi:BlaI family transcriptional regulator, penicillinase repressor
MKRAAYITPGEFELMEILWPMGEASVRQVWERIHTQRAVAYTTVMTVLYKMHRKGLLSQRKQGKAYLYSPSVDREQALVGVVEHMLKAYFKGSPQELLRYIHKGEETPDGGGSAARKEVAPASSIDEFLL